MTDDQRIAAGWTPTARLRWEHSYALPDPQSTVPMIHRYGTKDMVLAQLWVRSHDGATQWWPVEEAP